MKINMKKVQEHLSSFSFRQLFTEGLGWDLHPSTLSIPVAGVTYRLEAVAEKRGLVAWACAPTPGSELLDGGARKKIEARVARTTRENLVIFIDSEQEKQLWCWARREPGRPVVMREHAWHKGRGNTAFLQKLEAIAFSINEEEELNLPKVTSRVRAAFDVEKVTKAFYNEFKKKQCGFLRLIEGIENADDRRWYASLMLNRLMFIYFMQRKNFFNNDPDYLRNQLRRCENEKGKEKFYSFYRHFLLRLFHEGLGDKKRTAELDKLLGKIPYLNSGLFEKHPIEERCPDIHIPDQAFRQIFDFFKDYQWHLDERLLRKDNEINPDVLGYIFEKHVNQKEMGAYYTKEDITDYITRNSVLPFLLDMAAAQCSIAFKNPGGPTVWDHLRKDPERYMHSELLHGHSLDLPQQIEDGITDLRARSKWNQRASAKFALPTETWRDVIARRQRCKTTLSQLAREEELEINSLTTLNLDIRQFAQDVIERCEGPDLLRAFWKALQDITILDPTCGSGAFLFAALNILEPLYQACVERMRIFVEDAKQSKENLKYGSLRDFHDILAEISKQPNENYFVLKSVILNNLFGVDIMDEAVEICKLRLFLKLAAQVEPDISLANLGIEPLPDIDFNICTGNTLVGYASYGAVQQALSQKLDLDGAADKINRKAAELQQAHDLFRKQQIQGNSSAMNAEKSRLRNKQSQLANELNRWLALDYGANPKQLDAYNKWLGNYKPFHWFIEFYGILQRRGFDVIIGNPPYLELNQIGYKPTGLETVQGRAVHAMCIERSLQLLNDQGAISMIVPLSLTSTQRMKCVQNMLEKGRGGGGVEVCGTQTTHGLQQNSLMR